MATDHLDGVYDGHKKGIKETQYYNPVLKTLGNQRVAQDEKHAKQFFMWGRLLELYGGTR